MLLTSEGFKSGTTTVADMMAKNVGDIHKITLRTAGSDNYACSTIRVQQEEKFWEFDCEEEISCPKHCSTEMKLGGS